MIKKLKIDIFDILINMQTEKLDRTVYISTENNPKKNDIMSEIKKSEFDCFLKDNSHIGIPLSIRKLRGNKIKEKKGGKCRNIFIEFMMPNSVNFLNYSF